MTLKYALYGLCFGWVLMPRWRARGMKIPLSILAYAAAIIAAMLIIYFFEYSRQSWAFTVGVSTQLLIFAGVKWVRYYASGLGRKIRR